MRRAFPLVIAGGDTGDSALAYVADQVVRRLQPSGALHRRCRRATTPHSPTPAFARWKTHSAAAISSRSAICDSTPPCRTRSKPTRFFAATWITWSRAAPSRWWMNSRAGSRSTAAGRPALHTAVEDQGRRQPRSPQGMVLGSTTIQHLVALYPRVCGMTGTAATQAIEFRTVYGLYVETIPTNRPVIRVDHPDVLFPTKAEKERAVADEIRRVHATGQPILVGTASVEESERLSRNVGRPSALRIERAQRRSRGGHRRPGRPARRRHHFDQHGRDAARTFASAREWLRSGACT